MPTPNEMTEIVIRVAIVDDEASVRDSLRYWLNHAPGFQCVGAWNSTDDALESISWNKPNALLLDLHLLRDSSLAAIPELKKSVPNMAILMLTGEEDYFWVKQALQAGADGYLLKKNAADNLALALKDVLKGGKPLSADISRRLIQEHIAPASDDSELASLTPRERMILQKLSEGLVYKEIAHVCDISLETVRTHARRILKKLGVGTKTEAVLKFLKARQ